MMKITIFVSIALISTCSYAIQVESSYADDWMPLKCKRESDSCVFFINPSEEFHAYRDKDGGPEYAYENWDYRTMLVDLSDFSRNSNRVAVYDTRDGWKFWVDRKSIILLRELERVTACWPIKQISFDNGDSPETYSFFDRNGSEKIDIPSEKGGWRGQAWSFKRVFIIRYSDGSKDTPWSPWSDVKGTFDESGNVESISTGGESYVLFENSDPGCGRFPATQKPNNSLKVDAEDGPAANPSKNSRAP